MSNLVIPLVIHSSLELRFALFQTPSSEEAGGDTTQYTLLAEALGIPILGYHVCE